MKPFYETDHCRSRMHCVMCRDLDGGRDWRCSVVVVFSTLLGMDFECPEGVGWLTISKPDPEAEYEAAKAHIQAMRAAEDIGGLKEELRLTEDFLSLHANQTPCWKARQKARLVRFVKLSRLAWAGDGEAVSVA